MDKLSLVPRKVILGINQLEEGKRVAFIESCLEKGIQVLKLPPTKEWINDNIQVSDLKEINFEDLLSRPPIELNLDQIDSAYRGKTILVTGCAGTIGSEIVRQLIHHQPACILGLDQAETPIADLRLEINGHHCFKPIIGSVRDISRVEAVFLKYKPEVVFHAAAYKHVPEMEAFPQEAIKTNTCGTKVVADLAIKHRVERFVLISTDKAVNPTNVMGATKRVAELYVQALSGLPILQTHFITTRFGNVLGSNGSVVPIFLRNIAQRQPVTVTHPDITRYFMTTKEACQLVLQAGSAGKGGEIFVFDMGKPVRIQDMARKLIQMAGLIPDVDIPIVYSGLRPGEKMHEELFTDEENLKPTVHPKIMLAQSTIVPYDTLNGALATLEQLALQNANRQTILAFLQDLIPEYTPMEPVATPYQKGNPSSNGIGVHVVAGVDTVEGLKV
jgi:FlaA1/EpsC-like NDP-sugar epimerase